ncbi:MAG: hypothetical protein WCN95_01540 [bacterium]
MAESLTRRSGLRKWLRRTLYCVVVVLALLVLVIAIAPSLLFCRAAERKLSSVATQFIGRPVIIEDLAFGWRTPLHASRISLPAIEGEGGYPLVDIRGVSLQLTLTKIAMLPPYSLSVDIDKIEFNLVKTKSGETNLVSLLSKFSGTATNKPPAKPESGTSQLPVLPLRNLNINLHRIDIRFVDLQKGMAAGLEGGSVCLEWPGGNQPLTGKFAGDILLNKTRLPWELGIDLRSWINADRMLTINKAVLTIDSGGGTNASIFLDASAAGGRPNVVHIALPMTLITQVNKALNLSPVLPDLGGELDLRLTANHDDGFTNFNISSTLTIKDIKVTGTTSSPGISDPSKETNTPGESNAGTNTPATGPGFDGTLGIAGRITLNTSVALPKSSDGPAAFLKVKGELITEINSLDVAAGKIGISLCDFIDRRHFDIAMDPASPADLTYADDAHTGLSALEGTMGVTIGKCSLAAKTRYVPPGTVFYDIAGAEVSGLAFASPDLQLTVPPIGFSGGLSARLKDSTFEGKNLKLTLGNFFEATCAPFFNWTNGVVQVAAGMKLSSLSNVLAMVQIRSTNVVIVLPQLSGGISGAVNIHGTLPKAGFIPGDPLPIAGDATVCINDVGMILGTQLAVSGINATARVDLAESGRDILTSLGCRVANVATGDKKVPPLANIHLAASAAVHDFNQIEVELKDFGIDSLLTSASARLNVGGLAAAISTNTAGTDAVKWLHALYIDGTASFTQDLKGVSSLVPGLESSGKAGVSIAFNNSPLRSLSASANLNLSNINIDFADIIKIGGVNGSWNVTKTFLAPGEGRQPISTPSQRIMIDSINFKSPKLSLAIHKTAISLQGLEQGMKISLAVPDMIGGPTEAACSLSMKGRDPELAAKLTITGLNGGALFPGLEFKNPGDGDINAVADVSMILPPNPRGMLLDYLALKLRTMRIGKEALMRVLKAMDSRQETPQFQSAITALTMGTPIGAEFTLANSLVTISAELRIAGGIKVPLQVLDSAPLSDIMGVYKLEGAEHQLNVLRGALLLLMTNDLTELEKGLAPARQ